MGESESTGSDDVVVHEPGPGRREAVEPFEQWLSLTDRRPLRRTGEYQTGRCVPSPGSAIDPAATLPTGRRSVLGGSPRVGDVEGGPGLTGLRRACRSPPSSSHSEFGPSEKTRLRNRLKCSRRTRCSAASDGSGTASRSARAHRAARRAVHVSRATTVAEWLEATPPPEGWDTTPLVDGVPCRRTGARLRIHHADRPGPTVSGL
jgi:hypothetical protein